MTRDIRVWTIDEGKNDASELIPDRGAEAEESLEELLSCNPHLLMPNLTLVARQAPAGGGTLDLLGIDNNGRMIVFELKREKAARESVAQIIDYSSYLESLSEDDLAEYVSNNSGKNGINNIHDFQGWYEERHGSSESELRPLRMMLVAFDADVTTQRMVEFLNSRGVAIAIQTYSKYRRGQETLMVGHHDRAVEVRIAKQRAKQSVEEGMRALDEYAQGLEMEAYWQEVMKSLSFSNSVHPRNNQPPRKSGVTFYQRNLKLSENGVGFNGSHSLLIEEKGKLRVTFFPISIHLCEKAFDEVGIELKKETPRNVPSTDKIEYQCYYILTEEDWKTHRAALTKLTKQVSTAWERRRTRENAVLP